MALSTMGLSFMAYTASGVAGLACFSNAHKYEQLSEICSLSKPIDGTPGLRVSQINRKYSMMGYHDGTDFVRSLSYEYSSSMEPNRKSFNRMNWGFSLAGAGLCGVALTNFVIFEDERRNLKE
jgi:hypothetical protein